jgi:hypothetical protein
MPDAILPADVLTHFSMNTSVLLQRWETWYFKPHAEYVPLCISDVDEATGNLRPRDISLTYNARTAGFLDAVRTVPTEVPVLGQGDRVNAVRIPGWTDAQSADVTIAPPEAVAPSTRRDLLHLTSGHSASTRIDHQQAKLAALQRTSEPLPEDLGPVDHDPETGQSPFQWPRKPKIKRRTSSPTRLPLATARTAYQPLPPRTPAIPRFY